MLLHRGKRIVRKERRMRNVSIMRPKMRWKWNRVATEVNETAWIAQARNKEEGFQPMRTKVSGYLLHRYEEKKKKKKEHKTT